jgi:hypothetical protein
MWLRARAVALTDGTAEALDGPASGDGSGPGTAAEAADKEAHGCLLSAASLFRAAADAVATGRFDNSNNHSNGASPDSSSSSSNSSSNSSSSSSSSSNTTADTTTTGGGAVAETEESAAESKTKPKTESKTEPKTESKPESKTESKPESAKDQESPPAAGAGSWTDTLPLSLHASPLRALAELCIVEAQEITVAHALRRGSTSQLVAALASDTARRCRVAIDLAASLDPASAEIAASSKRCVYLSSSLANYQMLY